MCLPYKTGGQVLLRPEVSGSLEVVLHDEASLGLLLENLTVAPGSEVDGKAVTDPGFRLEGGDTVLVSGRDELLLALRAWQHLDVAGLGAASQ